MSTNRGNVQQAIRLTAYHLDDLAKCESISWKEVEVTILYTHTRFQQVQMWLRKGLILCFEDCLFTPDRVERHSPPAPRPRTPRRREMQLLQLRLD